MNRRANNVAIFLGWLVIACAPARFVAAAEEDLLAHGTDEMYWIAQVQKQGSGQKITEQTLIRARQVAGDARWTEVGRISARIISIASRGSEAVVLLESGEWMILWPGGSSMGALPADKARLVALGSGPTSLWAIGVSARSLATTQVSSISSPATAAIQNIEGPGLYRLERGAWMREASLPENLQAGQMSLAVVNGEPVLAVLGPDDTVSAIRFGEGNWEDLGSIHSPQIVQFKLLGGMRSPALWTAPQEGAGELRFYSNGWSEARNLDVPGFEPATPSRTIAAAAQNIRLVLAKGNQLFEQAFTSDAQPLGKPAALPQLPAQIEPLPLRWLTVAAAAMLMFVVIGSVRRGPPPDAVAGITPAPLPLRFMAGMIDAVPLAVAMVLLSRDVTSPEPTIEELRAAVGYPFYLSLAIYLLHTWLSEQLFGRTIGKFIFGLRVVGLSGGAPGSTSIFIRNLLRLVDVMIVVPLLLVIFSPLRQRVGDIAARTVVVIEGPKQQIPESDDVD